MTPSTADVESGQRPGAPCDSGVSLAEKVALKHRFVRVMSPRCTGEKYPCFPIRPLIRINAAEARGALV
jgi:hypothetical protein